MVMTNGRPPLKAVLLDWAGTTVDYGSRAPTAVFIEIFRRCGITITADEARGPMGRGKRDHIATIVALPRITALWQEIHGRTPVDADIDGMYHEFLPLQKETLSRMGSDVIPGVPEAIAALRSRGLAIGSTTGYTRELMGVVAPRAAQGGVCSRYNHLCRRCPLRSTAAVDEFSRVSEAGRVSPGGRGDRR